MAGLAQKSYMGPDIWAYLDTKYKGTLLDDWDEVERTPESGPLSVRLRRRTSLRDPAPVRTRESREMTFPGQTRARIQGQKESQGGPSPLRGKCDSW